MIRKAAASFDAAAIVVRSLDHILVEQYIHFVALFRKGMPKSERLEVVPIQPLKVQLDIRQCRNVKTLLDTPKLRKPENMIS